MISGGARLTRRRSMRGHDRPRKAEIPSFKYAASGSGRVVPENDQDDLEQDIIWDVHVTGM